MVGGWWLVAGGWWLVVGGWWLVAGGWWSVTYYSSGSTGRSGRSTRKTEGTIPCNAPACLPAKTPLQKPESNHQPPATDHQPPTTNLKMSRTIFHVDMDAFYASVEQRDHPEYQGKPLIVGADPLQGRGRGVVAACSYEARKFGLRSALPISRAWRLCPEGIYLRPDFKKYRKVSRRIRKIFHSVTHLVEPLSIDEAFLDVSAIVSSHNEAFELARSLKQRIFVTAKLTASIGIGPSKFIAKIASDLKKPNGLVLVRPEQVLRFLDPLPISRIWGVGPKTEARLERMGVKRISQLRGLNIEILVRHFGKTGEHLWNLANGIDNRPVVTGRETKSVSHEHTFAKDVRQDSVLNETLLDLSEKVFRRLQDHGLKGKTVTLKLRYADFTTLTRQSTRSQPLCSGREIGQIAVRLLNQHRQPERDVRLIGVAVSSLQSAARQKTQLKLFTDI